MSTKPKKSTKKTAKPAENKKKTTRPDFGPAVPYILGFVALFVILTFFLSDTGKLGISLSNGLKGIFGAGYFFFPFLLLLLAFYWKRDKEKGAIPSKIMLAAVNFVFLLILIHAVTSDSPDVYGIALYDRGKELNGAGYMGGHIGAFVINMLGNAATIILSLLILFVTTVLLFGSTPKATVLSIVEFFKNLQFSEDSDEKPVRVKKEKRKKIKAVKEVEEPEPVVDESTLVHRFELPDQEPAPPSVEKDIVDLKGINREAPWEDDRAADPELTDEDEEIMELYEEAKVEKGPYVFPPLSLLAQGEDNGMTLSEADVKRTSQKLVEVLKSFGVHTKVINTSFGPTITRYELQPESGVRVKSIANLADDISLHLAATSVRIESIPGKSAVGIEIPNRSVATVRLRDLIDTPVFRDNKSPLFVALGMDVAGNPIYFDIPKMPHLLIAGATGMGKSVCINSIIVSLLYRAHPDEVKLILIDPKRIELSEYNSIPHLMVPVINDPKTAAGTLSWACIEMEKRYTLIQEVGVRNLAEYNAAVVDDPEREQKPYTIIVIDELADLMMTAPDNVESSIIRLAQKARAAGMFLIIGTQRPSVDVITGLIKANIPSRISFTVASQVDSRTILDMAGAEKLLGRGDMLYAPVGSLKPIRVQGAYVDGKTEVNAVAQFIKEAAEAEYDEEVMDIIEKEAKLCGVKASKRAQMEEEEGDDKDDPIILDALEIAIETGNISTSMLQRRLSLGYARAARIVDRLEARGYIGEFDASTKRRDIMISREEFLEMKLNAQNKDE